MKKLTPRQEQVYRDFVEYGQNALKWKRKCALLLPEINKEKIWAKRGFHSIYEFAAKLAGMSHSSVDEALRVLERIKEMPELQRIASEKGIQRVRPVATIVTKETEKFWAKKAEEMSKNTLETYVKDYRLEFLPREKCKPENPCENGSRVKINMLKVSMELSVETIEALKVKKGDKDWETFMQELLHKNEVRDAISNTPKTIRKAKRYIPVEMKKYVKRKSGGLCAFPGCAKKGEIFHHTNRFALNKEHNSDKLVLLCKGHERLAHLGLIKNEQQEAKQWRPQKERILVKENWDKLFIDRFVNLYR